MRKSSKFQFLVCAVVLNFHHLSGADIDTDKIADSSAYIKSFLASKAFIVEGDGNTLNWNTTPSDITSDIDIFAGYKIYGNVSDNTLNFNQNNTNYIKEIRAGFAYDGIAMGNKLNISNGNIGISAISGRGSKGALNNTIKILAGDFIGFTKIYAGSSEIRDVINNGIEIENGTFTQEVEIYAGYTHANAVVSNAIKNYLGIKDGSFSGKVKIYAGYSKNGSVEQNYLTISGGSFVDQVEIYGGYSELGDVSSNTINITGGKFAKTVRIYGGYSKISKVINNTVNLHGEDLNLPNIYGGAVNNPPGYRVSNNTLNIIGKNIRANDIGNFKMINFYLPKDFDTAKDKMLSLNHPPYILNSKIGVGMMQGGVLKMDDEIVLIDVQNGNITYPLDKTNHVGQLQSGISAVYEFELKDDGGLNKKLIAKVIKAPKTSKDFLPYPKNVIETTIGELGMLLSSSDMI
ncbi:hypothetical protein ACPF04_10855, partial [Campylobacter sp. MOP51]